jgi:hypothetical protein
VFDEVVVARGRLFGDGFRAACGGAGCNSTYTGFGTSRGEGASPVLGSIGSFVGTMRTGTLCGWKPGCVKVAVNSFAATVSVHGVRQVWPVEVLASAPAGSDSNCTVVAAGAALGRLKLGMLGMLEQAPSARLRARDGAPSAMATARFMIVSVHPAATGRAHRNPNPDAQSPMITGQCALITVNESLSNFTLRNRLRTILKVQARRLSAALIGGTYWFLAISPNTASGSAPKSLMTRSGPSLLTGISV